jgi:hypothetical protein
MLLQQAVAARQSRSAASAADSTTSWRHAAFMKAPEEEELDESQKGIKELEALDTAKEEEQETRPRLAAKVQKRNQTGVDSKVIETDTAVLYYSC